MDTITAVAPAAIPDMTAAEPVAAVSERTKPEAAARPDPPSRHQVQQIVDDLNENIRIINTSISFSVDHDTGKTVIKVMDADSQKLIRQIPPDEMLRVASRLKDLLGVLFDKTR